MLFAESLFNSVKEQYFLSVFKEKCLDNNKKGKKYIASLKKYFFVIRC